MSYNVGLLCSAFQVKSWCVKFLKQAIIKVYFPWYQRSSSEKQAKGLWGILSIKCWLAASAAMESWK